METARSQTDPILDHDAFVIGGGSLFAIDRFSINATAGDTVLHGVRRPSVAVRQGAVLCAIASAAMLFFLYVVNAISLFPPDGGAVALALLFTVSAAALLLASVTRVDLYRDPGRRDPLFSVQQRTQMDSVDLAVMGPDATLAHLLCSNPRSRQNPWECRTADGSLSWTATRVPEHVLFALPDGQPFAFFNAETYVLELKPEASAAIDRRPVLALAVLVYLLYLHVRD